MGVTIMIIKAKRPEIKTPIRGSNTNRTNATKAPTIDNAKRTITAIAIGFCTLRPLIISSMLDSFHCNANTSNRGTLMRPFTLTR